MATLGRIIGCCAAAFALWTTLLSLPAHSPPVGPSDLAPGVENAIARREYEASRNELGLQAPNRAHGLRTYFDPSGVRVHDRTADGSPRLVAFELAALGRGAERRLVESGEVFAAGARVEIRRGELTEWYENSPRGLEQGFDLAQRPPGDGELFLELTLSGVTARPKDGGLELRSATGRRLRYEKLAAFDATGRALPARMELADSATLRLVVTDADAAYPLTIDPLLSATQDALVEADQASAQLGVSVASAGDVNGDGYADVIVGANLYDAGHSSEGAAFVFLGSATGIADGDTSGAARLEGDQTSAQLGRVVAGAGDVNGDGYDDVIVGARFYDAPEVNEGAAFIFHGGPTGISSGNPASAATQIESNQLSGQLGSAVGGAGDVNGDGYADVIVGAWFYTDPEFREGGAFIFHGGPAGIPDGDPTNAATVLQSNQADALFGHAAAGAGDVNGDGYADVIVGAYEYDAGETNEGAAFVFLGSATGIADGDAIGAHAQLESNQDGAQLGIEVAPAGDVNGDGYDDVIVGSYLYDSPEVDAGAAFVFRGGAAGVPDGNPSTASGRIYAHQAGAQLGASVEGAGDVNGDGYADLVVGAQFYDGPEVNEGAAWVYFGGTENGWTRTPSDADVELDADVPDARFGFDVAGAGDVNGDGFADLISGAQLYDGSFANAGAAFVFLGANPGTRSGLPSAASTRLTSGQSGAFLGASVAAAGDLNGDGYGDVIVGAPDYDSGEADEGVAFVFLGRASPDPDVTPIWADTRLESDQPGARFGHSVARAGDLNGDGYGDVIIGAPNYDAGLVDEGAAFIFLGGNGGIDDGNTATAAARLESDQADALLGYAVASAGDLNGDGFADVAVSAAGFDSGQDDEGAVFVFSGGPEGIPDGNPSSAAATVEANQTNTGEASIASGDVNGDGFSDLIVGFPSYDDSTLGGADTGVVLLFPGGSSGIASGGPAAASTRIDSHCALARLGQSVAGVGDADGDGYEDILVGAPGYCPGGEPGGRAFLFGGGAGGIPSATISSARETLRELGGDEAIALGASVAGAGDVNGDGRADYLVGAPEFGAASGQSNPLGAAYLFFGLVDPAPHRFTIDANAVYEQSGDAARLGWSVAGAGDVNADGFADVIIGAPGYDIAAPSEGGAFVWLGNDGRTGRRGSATQYHAAPNNARIGPGGLAADPHSFRPHIYFAPPSGPFSERVEVEVCAAGVAFGSPQCSRQQSAWYSVLGGSQYAGFVDFAGLTPDRAYRWRGRALYAPYWVTQPGVTPPPNPAHGPWRRMNGQLVEAGLRTPPDADSDGIADGIDNCPLLGNPTQQDTDLDGFGNLCDLCPLIADPTQANFDGDTLGDVCDSDDDNDGLADESEPGYGTNPFDADTDDDGANDAFEAHVLGTSPTDPDSDDDTTLDGADNCPLLASANLADADGDTRGDVCDNCPRTENFDQADTGGLNAAAPDGVGDVCQNGDWNGDGTADIVDVVIIRQHLAGAQAVDPRMPPEP